MRTWLSKLSFSLLGFLKVCLWYRGCPCPCVCLCGSQKTISGVPSSGTVHLAFETGYLTDLELTKWARMAGLRTSGIYLPVSWIISICRHGRKHSRPSPTTTTPFLPTHSHLALDTSSSCKSLYMYRNGSKAVIGYSPCL